MTFEQIDPQPMPWSARHEELAAAIQEHDPERDPALVRLFVVSFLDWHVGFTNDEISAAFAAGHLDAHTAITAGTVRAAPFRFRSYRPDPAGPDG